MRPQLLVYLIRSLIPRWNFFDVVGHHFEIQVRPDESKSWEKINFSRERRLANLFFNPETNLAWLHTGLIEQFAIDVQQVANDSDTDSADAVRSLDTYEMVHSLVRSHAQKTTHVKVQYRIVAFSESDTELFEVYMSNWIERDS